MIHKRPFVDDDSYEVSYKLPRHLEYIDQLAPIASFDDACQKIVTSDGDDNLSNCQDVGRSANDLATAVPSESRNFESGASSSFPHFLWINNGILEADNLSFFPEYFDHGQQLRALLQPDEMFSSIDYPFRKPVSIGPEHQAFVPYWESPITSSIRLDESTREVVRAQSSSSYVIVDDGYEERLMGTCVIPMPELEALATHCCESTKTDCSCPGQGSIECVKQHIMESRKKLREDFGEEIFEGLGFHDMGEDVAKKWTEDEEKVFHDIVLLNPASLRKNFWDHLPEVFPSRTKKELVSYYFNVFMLEKRSEQNRFDPLNIDSDDDEWQKNEAGIAEEDEDSAVESLNGQDAPYYPEDHAEDCNEHIEDEDETGAFKGSAAAAAADIRDVATDEEYEGDLDNISAAHGGMPTCDCGGNTGSELVKGIPSRRGNDWDIEDDSCTSYEYQGDNVDCCGPLDMVADGSHSGKE